MKSYLKPSRIRIALFLLLIGLCPPSGMSQQQGSVSPAVPEKETYVSEVIIQAPWAERCLYEYGGGEESPPGEFGMHVTGEGPPLTPSGFTVAPNGDIYINDQLNKRIQKFRPNGEFVSVVPISGEIMCVDKQNNMFVGSGGGIHKYDQNGKLLQTYQLPVYDRRIGPDETESGNLAAVYCDELGRVFGAFSYRHMKVDRVAETIRDTTWGGICQIGSGAGAFSPDEQENTLRKQGFLGSNSAALDKGCFTNGPGGLHLIGFVGDTIVTYRSITGSFFGCDKNLNVYTTRYDRGQGLTIVRKYNPKGTLISAFGYRCDKPYLPPWGRGEFLDGEGNIYVYCESDRDGIQVTKWHKAN
jgi:hypothetical protein